MSDYSDIRLKPYKKDFDYSYTEGVFPTVELLRFKPEIVFRVICTENCLSGDLLSSLCKSNSIPLVTDTHTIERLTQKGSTMAIGAFRKYTCELDNTSNHIVLVSPADMGNLGTMIRTCVAFDIHDIAIIRPAADIFDPKTVRASMGAAFRLRFSYFDSFSQYSALCDHSKRDFYPFMLSGSDMYSCRNAERAYSLIFGNESSGLDKSFENIGKPLRIMHTDNVDSLNLTIAAGIGISYFYSLTHIGGSK